MAKFQKVLNTFKKLEQVFKSCEQFLKSGTEFFPMMKFFVTELQKVSDLEKKSRTVFEKC